MNRAVSLYARVLGEVLREHRKAKRWTRKQFKARLPDQVDVSLQTLATYELGTRHIHVERLDELARALGTRAHLILAEVDRRLFPPPSDTFVINLVDLAQCARPDLTLAARWAAVQVDACDGTTMPTAKLTPDALETLADLCGIDMTDLFDVLRDFQFPGSP